MKLRIKQNFPYCKIKIYNGKNSINLENVIIDICSSTTMISTDKALEIGLKPELKDKISGILGINGPEFVCEKMLDQINFDNKILNNIKVDIGSLCMDDIDAIIGMDILLQLKAVIDFGKMAITTSYEIGNLIP